MLSLILIQFKNEGFDAVGAGLDGDFDFLGEGEAVALGHGLAVDGGGAAGELDPGMGVGECVLDLVGGVYPGGVEVGLGVPDEGVVAAVGGGDEVEEVRLLGDGEVALLVGGWDAGCFGEEPELEEVDWLRVRAVVLGVAYAGAGGHVLGIARDEDAAGADGVLMAERAGEDPGDDLHLLVAVGAEAAAGLDDVLVDDAEVAEAHECGVVVFGEGEGEAGDEPATVGEAAVLGFAEGDHGSAFRPGGAPSRKVRETPVFTPMDAGRSGKVAEWVVEGFAECFDLGWAEEAGSGILGRKTLLRSPVFPGFGGGSE